MTTERSKQRIPTILARLEYATVALSKTSAPDDAPPPAVSAEWYSQDVRFLLAEVDGAARDRERHALVTPATPLEQELTTLRAREAKLREALTKLAREALVVVGFAQAWTPLSAGDIADLRRAGEQARAALAEGDPHA